MNLLLRSFLVFASLLILGNVSFAQNETDFFSDDGFFQEDTTTVVGDTIVKGNTFFKIFKGDPGKAAMYSLLIPGGGQVYNKSWWKVPIALGIDGVTIYSLIFYTRLYNEYRDGYLALLNDGVPFRGFYENVQGLKAFRDNANKNRQYAYIWLIVGHLVTVFDAYVDNHLKDFDISDDLSFKLQSDPELGTRLSLVIPLHTNKYKKLGD